MFVFWGHSVQNLTTSSPLMLVPAIFFSCRSMVTVV